MPDFGPGYDPSQANYISATDQAIGAMIALSAFGALAAGAYAFGGSAVAVSSGTISLEASNEIVEAAILSKASATGIILTAEEASIAAEIEAYLNGFGSAGGFVPPNYFGSY